MLRIAECYRGGFESRPGWWLGFHLIEGFADDIERLKAAIPPGERSYDPELKRWWISEDWATTITSLIPGLEAHLHQRSLPGFA